MPQEDVRFEPPKNIDKITLDEKELDKDQTSLSLEEDEREYFKNALRIGWHEKTAHVFGHEVRARTLTVDEELQVAEIVSPHQGSTALSRAWTVANVAAAVQEIDGKPLFVPISSEDSAKIVHRKYDKIKKYYPAFIDQIYADVVKPMNTELVERLRTKLGK